MAYDVKEMEAYIRQRAGRMGMDPDTAVRVAKSEGLARGTWQSNVTKNGVREPSYGPFQLLVGGGNTGFPGGLGNDFIAATGLDPSDPANAHATVDFALDRASKVGWQPWYGAKHVGVGRWDGINGAKPIGIGATSNKTASLTAQAATPGQPNAPVPQSAPAQAGATAPVNAPAQAQPKQGGFMDMTPGAGDKGLINMLLAEGPNSMDKFKTFMGGTGDGSVSGGVGAGLAMLAQGMGQGSAPAPVAPAAPAPVNRPDISLLQMLPRRGQRKIGRV